MLKKAVVVAGGAALLLGLFFGRESFSYVSTAYNKLTGAVNDSVPLEFQIDRARDMIKSLTPEIRQNEQLIAREEIAIDRLAKQISQQEEELAQARQNIERLTSDLKRGDSNFVYAGHTYSEKQVKTDLANRFTRYKTNEDTVAKSQAMLAARKQGLAATREKLDAMLAGKRQLEVEVENLEARLKMVEVAQTTSEINLDDSRLSRAKDLVAEIQSRIDVAEKLAGSHSTAPDIIPLEEEQATHEDITDEVTSYFNGDSEAEAEALVKSN